MFCGMGCFFFFFFFYKGRKGVYEREHDCTMSGKHC